MNIFRIAGDLLHIASILIILYRLYKSRSCAGLSLKSQILYAVLLTCRYLDLFLYWAGLYNTILKILFLGASYSVVYLMMVKYKRTYEADSDTFNIWYIIAPCAAFGVVFHHPWLSFFEVLWSFSIWLESVAILPQLFMLQKRGEVETMNAHYVFTLGGYRVFYLLNWIWRLVSTGHYSLIAWTAGLIQAAVFGDFFYHYYNTVMKGRKMRLPQ
eukprot:ANDGO_02689.mRNA.1 ER lumen protein-retaining receptor